MNDSLSTLSSHDLLSVTEPAFSSLGLGGYSPVGLIQTSFETMHITFGMPWFEAIIAGTIAFRLLLLPLMIKGQINTARLNSIKPELDRIQTRLKELANTHDQMAKMQATMELQKLFRDNNCHPVKVSSIFVSFMTVCLIAFYHASRLLGYRCRRPSNLLVRGLFEWKFASIAEFHL